MNKEVFRNILIDSDLPENGMNQIKGLQSFNTSSYGNQVIDPRTDFVEFDYINELIYIKEKIRRLISGRFPSDVVIKGNKIIFKNRSLFLQHPGYSPVVPAVGFKVFTDSKPDFFKIIKIELVDTHYEITLDKNGLTKGSFIAYLDASKEESSIPDKDDKSLIFQYKNVSENKYDYILDMNSIMSISFDSEYVGNR